MLTEFVRELPRKAFIWWLMNRIPISLTLSSSLSHSSHSWLHSWHHNAELCAVRTRWQPSWKPFWPHYARHKKVKGSQRFSCLGGRDTSFTLICQNLIKPHVHLAACVFPKKKIETNLSRTVKYFKNLYAGRMLPSCVAHVAKHSTRQAASTQPPKTVLRGECGAECAFMTGEPRTHWQT